MGLSLPQSILVGVYRNENTMNIFSLLCPRPLWTSRLMSSMALRGVISSPHLVQCFSDRSVCRETPLKKWACMKFAIPSSSRIDGGDFLIIGGTFTCCTFSTGKTSTWSSSSNRRRYLWRLCMSMHGQTSLFKLFTPSLSCLYKIESFSTS